MRNKKSPRAGERVCTAPRRASIAALAVLLALPGVASATLGQDAASVQTDRVQLHAASAARIQRRAARVGSNYTVQDIQVPSGTTVREYLSAAGKVFAVTWRGPALPDLEQILGSGNYQTFMSDPSARRIRRRLRALKRSDLVVRSTGHQRDFSGYAYIPDLVPQGVNVEDLR